MLGTVKSLDGTRISFSQLGNGPVIVFVAGPLSDRTGLLPIARQLVNQFMVVSYDRRGRGDSGDTAPYGVRREVEDLDAVISALGGSASVFGFSSGATLALRAALAGSSILRLALYETALPVSDGGWAPFDLPERLSDLINVGRPGDAVTLFRIHAGLPDAALPLLHMQPCWSTLVRMARSCVYDATLTRPGTLPCGELSALDTSSLVINGTATEPIIRWGSRVVAGSLPNGHRISVPGNHNLRPEVVVGPLMRFLKSPTAVRK